MTAPTTERIPTERVRELLACDERRSGGVLLSKALLVDLAADLLDARSERDAAQHTADTLGARVTALEAARVAWEESACAELRALTTERDALADALRTERAAREAAEAQHAALAGSVREYLAALDTPRVATTGVTWATVLTTVANARAALDAALAAAEGTR